MTVQRAEIPSAASSALRNGGKRTYPDRGVHGRVVRTIGEDIVAGHYPAGEPLPPEPDLMIRLGVSRTAIREAIKVLAAKGLVQSRPKTGTRVRMRDDWNLLDPDILSWHAVRSTDSRWFEEMVALRIMIEPQAARIAAINATAADLSAIRMESDAMAEAVNDPDTYYLHDVRFHKALLTATGNRFLICMAPMVEALLSGSFSVQRRSLIPPSEGVILHDAISDAVIARDPDRAEAAMLKIIELARRQLKNAIELSEADKAAP
ncbi:FadR/GntR family transcriptional regulator [Fodinicurvata sp. EGI_FJ10296]|uniref:FadR/GntR family transcriptional regulator n=1 Tax=Fodinicurvata sp. EGI_FJ10296 TaxID=3231908 RepID=UPI00345387FD